MSTLNVSKITGVSDFSYGLANTSGISFAGSLYFPSTASIGIGTTSPSALLHLQSDYPTINITSTLSSRLSTIGMGDGYNLYITSPSSGYTIINQNGSRVGIGTISPNRTLVVSGSTATLGIYNTAASGGNMSIDAPSANLAQIDISGSHSFRINSNSTERLRIDTSGQVGIGVSSPTAKLDVNGTLNVGDNNSRINMSFNSSTGASLINKDNSQFVIGANNSSSQLVLHYTGSRVGIGKTPSVTFETQAPANATDGPYSGAFVTNYDRQGNAATRRLLLTSDNYRSTIQSQYLAGDLSWVANDLLLNVDGGKVGIATSSPLTTLHVAGGAILGGENTQVLPASNGGGGVKIQWNYEIGNAETDFINLYSNAPSSFNFYQKSGTSTANKVYFSGTGNHIWYIGGNEAVRIDSSSRMGIGTSSPIAKLHIEGSSMILGSDSTSTTLYVSNRNNNNNAANFPNLTIEHFSANTGGTNYGGHPVIELKRHRGTSAGSVSVQAGDVLGGFNTWGADGGGGTISATRIEGVADSTFSSSVNGYIRFLTTGSGVQAERMRIDASGNVSVTGIGAVYAPNRPAFRVYGSGTTNNLTTTQNGTGCLTANNWTVDYNTGTYLANTNGVFTAPVTGIYQVNIVGRNAGYASGISQLAVTKNGSSGGTVGGSVVCMLEFAASSSMNHAGVSSGVKLSAGDTLALKVLAGQINFDSNDNWSVTYIG